MSILKANLTPSKFNIFELEIQDMDSRNVKTWCWQVRETKQIACGNLKCRRFPSITIAIQLSYGLTPALKSIWSMVAGRISILFTFFARPMCQNLWIQIKIHVANMMQQKEKRMDINAAICIIAYKLLYFWITWHMILFILWNLGMKIHECWEHMIAWCAANLVGLGNSFLQSQIKMTMVLNHILRCLFLCRSHLFSVKFGNIMNLFVKLSNFWVFKIFQITWLILWKNCKRTKALGFRFFNQFFWFFWYQQLWMKTSLLIFWKLLVMGLWYANLTC
jgi:hypothetical protein